MSEKVIEEKQFFQVEVEDSLAILTIDHPPVNTLNPEILDQLDEIFNQLAQNPDIRVAILTGQGEKAFVAGADIKQFPELDEKAGKALAAHGQEILNKISQLPFPVICAINGFALGAGCELSLACDIRIASKNAKFGLPEVGLGIIPGYGGTQRLAKLVGIGKAKELIFSGELISAEEAYRIGLVERLVPVGESLNSAKELANQIAKKGPIAVQKAKQAIEQGSSMSIQEGLKLEAMLFSQLCETEDKNEGARAFLEKRTPNFKRK